MQSEVADCRLCSRMGDRQPILALRKRLWQNSDAMKWFLSELRRRNVHKVSLTYTVIAWLLIQLALIPALDAPGWAIKTLVVLVIIGFITIVFISWFFEATPEGMKRTADISPMEALPTWSRKKFTIFIASTALLAASLLVFELLQR